ncbi:hypothetical protein BJY04DRAFT_134573 [Aspergillus karnatakaensis]|uniref:uncharacterized protein n=1 Tax=Aspergillus karnatakaensis TaxID=1810916 RepID=UPI003CCCD06C
MSTSRIRTTFALFQKPKRPSWPDPEESIGKFCGTKKGKYNCWIAQGPARDAFDDIRPRIKQLLSSACGPVPSSSFVLFDIFMIGESEPTALPHIMFSCKHRDPRKKALAAVEQSDVLDGSPPGIQLGHWDYPPHIKDIRFLASDATKVDSQDNSDSSLFEYDIMPVYGRHGTETVQALQLRIKTHGQPIRTATIGGIVEHLNKRFYLAPAHTFSPQPEPILHAATDDVELDSEDSECEFGGFGSGDEDVSDHQEAEFMSQYSITPEPSDLEDEWSLDDDKSYASIESSEGDPFEILHEDSTDFQDRHIANQRNADMSHHPDVSPSGVMHPFLDYCLVEIDDRDSFSADLPVLSKATIGEMNFGTLNVTAITGSGSILTGTLSDTRLCIRLPNVTGYTDALAVHFAQSLQPGDSGSLVKDTSTGAIYGHIIAGDIGSQTALIIPATDVLNDVMASCEYIETTFSTLSTHNSTPPPLSATTLSANAELYGNNPKDKAYYAFGETDNAFALFFSASWPIMTPRERQWVIDYGSRSGTPTLGIIRAEYLLGAICSEIICFGMESAGVVEHHPSLVIKGICDYSETHESNAWQAHASLTASLFARELIHSFSQKYSLGRETISQNHPGSDSKNEVQPSAPRHLQDTLAGDSYSWLVGKQGTAGAIISGVSSPDAIFQDRKKIIYIVDMWTIGEADFSIMTICSTIRRMFGERMLGPEQVSHSRHSPPHNYQARILQAISNSMSRLNLSLVVNSGTGVGGYSCRILDDELDTHGSEGILTRHIQSRHYCCLFIGCSFKTFRLQDFKAHIQAEHLCRGPSMPCWHLHSNPTCCTCNGESLYIQTCPKCWAKLLLAHDASGPLSRSLHDQRSTPSQWGNVDLPPGSQDRVTEESD